MERGRTGKEGVQELAAHLSIQQPGVVERILLTKCRAGPRARKGSLPVCAKG